MPDRHEWPAGVPCWIDTAQPDPEAATGFYGALFGWEFEDRMPEGSDGRYYVATLGGRVVAAVGSQMREGAGPPAWGMYVAVDDADAAAAGVREAAGGVVAEPFDVGDAGRMAVFADPSGAVFCVWQAGGTRGVEAVNEPGTWNFSTLHTHDVEDARAFYGAVFGWELSSFGDGSGSGYWRMPGYGDFLERSDPEIRKRNAELGAPDRFEDAVATLMPLAEDEAPPHWSTTFAVDDADTIAARASQLGGAVLVPPTDAPWVRFTAIRDPQGAQFVASKFVPPDSP